MISLSLATHIFTEINTLPVICTFIKNCLCSGERRNTEKKRFILRSEDMKALNLLQNFVKFNIFILNFGLLMMDDRWMMR